MRHRRATTATLPAAGGERTGFLAGSRGSVLVGVMGITTVVLLVGMAIFVLGHSEGDIVEYAVDDARAFYVAEGGLERARGWLGELAEKDPTADPVGQRFSNETLGGGSYTVTVKDEVIWPGGPRAYEVVSKAEHGGVVRGVRAIMAAETFARYTLYIEDGGGAYSWFRTGERFDGPIHLNCNIKIDGDPWFGDTVRTSKGMSMSGGSNPTFTQGYELNCDEVKMPKVSDLEETIRVEAMNGGLYAGPLPKKAFYVVGLGWGGPGMLSYVGVKGGYGKVTPVTPVKMVDIASLNGAAWFDGDVAISGTLDGRLTIVADGDVNIWDDVLYYDATPYGGPNEGCDDVLGLIALEDVVISYTPPNQSDCVIHGVIMALEKNIEAEDYQHHAPRGDIVIYGGLAADESVHLAQMDIDGRVISGYRRDYRYDPRMFTAPPPFYPITGRYDIVQWEELRPNGA